MCTRDKFTGQWYPHKVYINIINTDFSGKWCVKSLLDDQLGLSRGSNSDWCASILCKSCDATGQNSVSQTSMKISRVSSSKSGLKDGSKAVSSSMNKMNQK